MKTLNKIIPLGGYPFDLMISFNETDEQLAMHLLEYGLTIEDGKDDMFHLNGIKSRRGRFVMFKGNQSVLRLNFYPHWKDIDELSLLQHEIFHCTHIFMEEINTPLKTSTCEPYAYLLQWLTREIYSLIINK
jgi:hypothetical protein